MLDLAAPLIPRQYGCGNVAAPGYCCIDIATLTGISTAARQPTANTNRITPDGSGMFLLLLRKSDLRHSDHFFEKQCFDGC